MKKDVQFSEDRQYRYKLRVEWDPELLQVTVIGMNPSKANEDRSDPTITKIIGFVKAWGGGSLMMLNLFGIVSSDPGILAGRMDMIGPLNTPEFIRENCEGSIYRVAAWGDYLKYAGARYHYRWLDVAEAVPGLTCLKRSERTGQPYHPLYLPPTLTPIPFKA